MSKKEKSKKVNLIIEIEENLYFNILKYCYENRVTIDDFVEKAINAYIKVHKKN